MLPPEKSAKSVQGNANHNEEEHHTDDSAGWDRLSGMIHDRSSVHNHEGRQQHSRQKNALAHQRSLPALPAEGPEHPAPDIAIDHLGKQIADHQLCPRGPPLLVGSVAAAEQQHQQHAGHDVGPAGQGHREDQEVGRAPENIPVDLLPATIVPSPVQAIQLLLLTHGVARKVPSQSLHEDHPHHSDQKQAQDKGVRDGKPMYLMLKEFGFQVSVVTVVEQVGCLIPGH
mmetsp:Transcript_97349/g.223079  ORF Transcript_97349/g.223079 Transcript_97349/m.223079 type:complete len:228 (-) Transcript_97349:121-804(-)